MSRLVTITVDGKPIEAEEGALLLPVLLKHGFEIPYYCYHEALGPDGNCRMCMVEIEGKKRPQISCDTFVEEGLVVRTRGESIEAVRRGILELQLVNHPVDCPVCDQAGECSLQDFYMKFGRYHGRVDKTQKAHFKKRYDLGRNVMLDQERCVLCRRCVRFVDDITKTHELAVIHRADHSVIDTLPGRKLTNDYAMNVVDLCPVGALTSKDFRFHQRVWFMTASPSICHGCAKGCNIYIDHAKSKWEDDTIYRFRPRKNLKINGHFICDDGRLGYKALQTNRLKEPRLSNERIGVEEALRTFKAWLQEADTVFLAASGDLYTEELEFLKFFADETGARLWVPLAAYLDENFGDDWLKNPMRAANAKGVEALGLATEAPEGEADLLLSVGEPPPEGVRAKRHVALRIHEGGDADLALPCASWCETGGSLTNVDGIVQRCEKVLDPEAPVPSVVEWFEALDLLAKVDA